MHRFKRTPLKVKQERLRALMKRVSMTSRQIAAWLDVHPVTVKNWMRGHHEIPTLTLEYLEYLSSKKSA